MWITIYDFNYFFTLTPANDQLWWEILNGVFIFISDEVFFERGVLLHKFLVLLAILDFYN